MAVQLLAQKFLQLPCKGMGAAQLQIRVGGQFRPADFVDVHRGLDHFEIVGGPPQLAVGLHLGKIGIFVLFPGQLPQDGPVGLVNDQLVRRQTAQVFRRVQGGTEPVVQV